MKNKKVVILSIIALIFIVLAIITKEWLFLVPAVIIMLINQKELIKKN